MKKTIALALALLTLILSLTGCTNKEYSWGNMFMEYSFVQNLHAKIVTNTLFYNKNNVYFDIFLGVYDINNYPLFSDDLPQTYILTIYVSNSENLPFDLKKYNYLEKIESRGNAELIRTIGYDEAFNTDFGYTLQSREIIYNHKEKIVIPEKFFTNEANSIYIHIITLLCYDDTDINEEQESALKVLVSEKRRIKINYFLLGNKIIVY